MAKERTSVRMQAQIKTLSEQGHSICSIAVILRLSRRTVSKFLEPVQRRPLRGGGWMCAKKSVAKGPRRGHPAPDRARKTSGHRTILHL
jgi:hypothetical protein